LLANKINLQKVGFIAIASVIGAGFLFFVFLVWAILNLPKLDGMADYRPALGTSVLARDGRVLGEFYDSERRYLVPMEKIPEKVVGAFLAAEDDGFYSHSGVDFLGILRAFVANMRAGQVVQGGSTITMQVAKALLLNSERSYGRKFRELLLAYKIEKNFTKQQILYLYLNQIYFGQRAYGIEAAAKTHFRKTVKDITVAEAALLAGLVKAPSSYAPTRDPVRAKERQLYVLRRMKETSVITEADYEGAIKEDIKVFPEEDPNSAIAPYYLEHIRQTLMAKYGAETLYNGGVVVETAADYDLSLTAMKAVRANLEELDKRQGYRGPIAHVATESAVLELLREIRAEVLQKKFGYQILPAKFEEGFEKSKWVGLTIDKILVQDPALGDERKFLQPWERYRAVVTKLDPEGKAASVMIGTIKGKLSINNMRWAKRVKPPEVSHWAQISRVQESLKTGDVIYVKPQLPFPEDANEPISVSLEQIPIVQSALLSIESSTGYVIAMVGGYDFAGSEYNRALQGERQPGSSFKPFLYSAALDRGFTPSSIIVDSPVIFENQGGGNLKWIPENNSEKFYGDTTLRTAIINSRNVPAVKLLQEVGLNYFTKYLRSIGLGGEFSPDLSLALGSKTISLLDITKLYALFPRLGMRIEPVFILKVTDRDGKVLEEYSFKEFQREISARWLEWKKQQNLLPESNGDVTQEPPAVSESGDPLDSQMSAKQADNPPMFDDPLRALDPKTAFIMSNLLQEVVLYGTGSGARTLKRKVGGKTGTTNDFVDAWFVGFSPEIVTGVWTGFDNPRTLGKGEVGSRAALPAWSEYMAAALERYKLDDFSVPKGIVFVRIDPKTGALAGPGNAAGVKEAYVEGTEPSAERQNQQTPDSSDFFREDL
jgi:penicillin-binding protein 1A